MGGGGGGSSFHTFTQVTVLIATLPCCRGFANDAHSLICKSHHPWSGILLDQRHWQHPAYPGSTVNPLCGARDSGITPRPGKPLLCPHRPQASSRDTSDRASQLTSAKRGRADLSTATATLPCHLL